MVTLTAPEEVRSCERSKDDWLIWNSEIALAGMFGGRRAHGLIADVNAIHVDARRTAKTATERNRGETSLGGVEVLAVLDLHPRLKLGEIKEVPPVDRQVLYLGGSHNTLYS